MKENLLNFNNEQIKLLYNGAVFACMFDGCEGIACIADNNKTVSLLYDIIPSNNVYLLVENEAKLHAYVNNIHEIAYDLLQVSDNKMILYFEQLQNVCTALLTKSASVGVAIPSDNKINLLLRMIKKPIVFFGGFGDFQQNSDNLTLVNLGLLENKKNNTTYERINLQKDGTFVLLSKI